MVALGRLAIEGMERVDTLDPHRPHLHAGFLGLLDVAPPLLVHRLEHGRAVATLEVEHAEVARLAHGGA